MLCVALRRAESEVIPDVINGVRFVDGVKELAA
jgi:hypothetical protein